jgi:outer membrane cobalamin receptor
MRYSKTLLILAFCFLSISGWAQTAGKGTIKGRISDQQEIPLLYISITVDSLHLGATTDSSGSYMLRNIPVGTHRISISALGYEKQTKRINVTENTISTLDFKLAEDIHSLEEVVIVAENQAKEIKQTGFNVNVIETKKFENITANVNQLLSQTAGVRIRETGGVGSDFNFSLNGLSGRQVKFFLDGEPLENYGSIFNLNNIPVNLVEHIEVYKGVVPVHLGADALGGAVNVVTKDKVSNYLDASYSYGSFNTHLANVSAQWRDSSSGFTIRPQVFYNYSDNNYTMYNVKTKTDISNDTIGNFKRFHDNYNSWMGSVQFGYTQKKWADKLLIDVSYGRVDSDVQTAARGIKNDDGSFSLPVAGEISLAEKTQKISLRYSKRDFLIRKLGIKLFATYSALNSHIVDTSNHVYNWAGQIITTGTQSEFNFRKYLFKYKQQLFLQNTGFTYEINERHQLSGNFVWSYVERQGKNTLGTNGDDPFADPNTLDKKVVGLSYRNNAFDDRLETNIFAKYYDMNILARNAREFVFGQFVIDNLKTKQQRVGGGIATRFKMKKWLVKASYEHAYRLPEAFELFGDGLRALANPDLLPESSDNINAGVFYKCNLGNASSLTTEVNGFMRYVDNMIFPSLGGNFLQYLNMQKIFIRGVEAELAYQYKQSFRAAANLTYQDVLNNNKYVNNTSVDNFVYRDRMYNTPFLFGNFDASYTFKNSAPANLNVSLLYSINYVNEFYLNYPKIAQAGPKFTVPTQFVQHAGITFSTNNNRWNLTFECRNLANALAYDNYALQKPGRAFYLKLRYFLS